MPRASPPFVFKSLAASLRFEAALAPFRDPRVEGGHRRLQLLVREAARLLDLGASTAIRWIERWTKTGSVEAMPGTGHSRSPLKAHEQ